MVKAKSIPIRKEVDEFGNVRYYNEQDQLHREDGLAVEWNNGDKFWYQNDKCHRENGPAMEWANGDKSWWYNDELIGESWKGFTEKQFEQWKKIKIFL